MTCTIKNNIKKKLVSQDIITTRNEIIDQVKFDQFNKNFIEFAETKYGVKVPNNEYFEVSYELAVDNDGNNVSLSFLNYNEQYLNLLDEAVKKFKEVNEILDGKELEDFDPLSFIIAEQLRKEKVENIKDGKKVNLNDKKSINDRYNEKLVDLSTSRNKILNDLKKAEANLNNKIRDLRKWANIAEYKKQEAKAEGYTNKAKELSQIIEDINLIIEENPIKAAMLYANTAKESVNFLKKKLENADLKKADDLDNVVKFYSEYVKSFAVIPSLTKTLNDFILNPDDSLNINVKEVKDALQKFQSIEIDYIRVKQDLVVYQKQFVRKNFNKLEYFPELEAKWIEKLRKQHKENNIKNKNVDSWIVEQLNTTRKEEIQKEIDEIYIPKLLEQAVQDISSLTKSMGNGINTNNSVIGIMTQAIQKLNDKYTEMDIQDDAQFEQLYTEFFNNKGKSSSLKSLYEKMLIKDASGKLHLRGDYKVEVLDFYKRKKAIAYEKSQIEDHSSKEYLALEKELETLTNKFYDKDSNKNLVLKDKWKDNKSNLSEVEKKVLNFFGEIIENSHKVTFGNKSLKKFAGEGIYFYELPKIMKSNLERALDGSLISLSNLKETKNRLKNIQPDEVGYVNSKLDGEGNPLYEIPIHYRDSFEYPMDPKQQSMDLFSIFRLEKKNANRYEVKQEAEIDISTFVDVVAHKPIYTTLGNKKMHNKDTGSFNYQYGVNNNIYKMLINMMEQQFYSISNKNGVTIAGVDANKLANYATGLSSFLSLTFNIGQGVANITNTQTQLFLESFIKGEFIKAANVKNANKIYSQHLKDTLNDNLNPVDKSFVNQLNEFWQVRGYLMGEKQDYLKNTLLKHGMSREALQIAQSTGEHWIQSTIAMATLDGVKVMNSKGDFIDKDGKVTIESKAASVLDMMKIGKNGRIEIDKNVVYTTHTRGVKWEEGGRTHITKLVSKKILDLVGNYKQDLRPDIYRHWYGKLFGQFRKYMYDMGKRRFLGISSSVTSKDNLREDQLNFSHSLKQYEEGTYTSLIRFISASLKNHSQGLRMMSATWENLSLHERANIVHASTELAITMALLAIMRALVKGIFDDDDKLVNFSLYQMRRLESEIAQFHSIPELFKIVKSPLPSAMLIEDTLGIAKQAFTDPFGQYEWSHYKGENKLKIKLLKKAPGIKEWYKDYQSLFNMQNSLFGVR